MTPFEKLLMIPKEYQGKMVIGVPVIWKGIGTELRKKDGFIIEGLWKNCFLNTTMPKRKEIQKHGLRSPGKHWKQETGKFGMNSLTMLTDFCTLRSSRDINSATGLALMLRYAALGGLIINCME